MYFDKAVYLFHHEWIVVYFNQSLGAVHSKTFSMILHSFLQDFNAKIMKHEAKRVKFN